MGHTTGPLSLSYQRQPRLRASTILNWIRQRSTATLRGARMNATMWVRTSAVQIAGRIARGRPSSRASSKLNLRENNMAAARPVSGVIHEPQSVTSDLQANGTHSYIPCTRTQALAGGYQPTHQRAPYTGPFSCTAAPQVWSVPLTNKLIKTKERNIG